MLKKYLINNIGSLLGFVLLGISIVAIHEELRGYNYQDILKSLTALPASNLYASIVLMFISYIGMGAYDTLSFRYIGQTLAVSKSVFTGFISSAATNTVGLAFLTGSAIRYRYYSNWGVSAMEIAQVIAFENISFFLGLFMVSGVVFLFNPLVIPTELNLPSIPVRPLGVIFLLLVAAYLLGSIVWKQPFKIREHEFRFPPLSFAFAQVIISSTDWFAATAVFYVLLPPGTTISYINFLGIFLLAMLAGIISNVPGGLGVFETVILHLLSPHVPGGRGAAFASLLAYRGVYYFLPLALATGLMGIYEIKSRFKTPNS